MSYQNYLYTPYGTQFNTRSYFPSDGSGSPIPQASTCRSLTLPQPTPGPAFYYGDQSHFQRTPPLNVPSGDEPHPFIMLPPIRLANCYSPPSHDHQINQPLACSSSSELHSSHGPSTATPTTPDAGEYLRHELGWEPGTPINLWSLPNTHTGPSRPPFSLPILVKLAIYGSTRKRLTLAGIFEAIEERFEFFKNEKGGAWKESIRHNLSLNKVFKKIPRPVSEHGRGNYWVLDVSEGEGYKRERKRRKRGPLPQEEIASEMAKQSISNEKEGEIPSSSCHESPGQQEGRIMGPQRPTHATSLSRLSSPYPVRKTKKRKERI